MRGPAVTDATPLDDIPPTSLSLVVRKQVGEGFQVQLRAAFSAAGGRPGPTEVATPGYVLVGAGAGFAVNAHLDLRVVARTLLDRSCFDGPDSGARPAPWHFGGRHGLVRF